MNSFLNGHEINFLFDIRVTCKIKIFDYHPTKPWVCFITENSIFQLWDYEKKVCLKTFHTSSVDIIEMSKTLEIKSLKFYDQNVLLWLLQSTQPLSEKESDQINNFKHNWIIFISENKIFFYDYIFDVTEAITPTQLEYKSVKLLEILDFQFLSLGCSDGSIKIFDISSWSFPKTMKGFHTKAINYIIPYKQNYGNRPRLIVSSLDGQLACWNVDTNTEGPAFKFRMIKNGKAMPNANDGQDILAMSYDSYNFKLITLTEDYITVWSSLSGMEISRYKNTKEHVKQICYFNNACFPNNTFLAHNKESELFTFDIDQEKKGNQQDTKEGKMLSIEYNTLIDLKNYSEIDRTIKIFSIANHCLKPHLLIIGTSHGFYIISYERMIQPNICFNYLFSSYLTVAQAKEYVNDQGDQKKLTEPMLNKLHQIEIMQNQQNLNFMFLQSFDKHIICTLFEMQTSSQQELSQVQINSKQYQFKTNFPWDESEIKCSLSGKYISVYNRSNGYYEILKANNQHHMDSSKITVLLDEDNRTDNIHFLSQLVNIYTGCAVALEWHQYRDEFVTLSPVSDKNKLVKLDEKFENITTGSFFSKKSYKRYFVVPSEMIKKIELIVYQITEPDQQIKMVMRYDKLINPTKLYSGEIYGFVDISTEEDINEILDYPNSKTKEQFKMLKLNKLQFFDIDRTQKKYIKYGVPILEPLKIYWSQSNKLCIVAYQDYFVIFRNEKQQIQFYKIVYETLTEGYFWEDLFFFATQNTINMLVTDFKQDIINIQLANLELKLKIKQIFNFNDVLGVTEELGQGFFDSIQPEIQKRSPGMIKILMIHDFKLITVNNNKEIGSIQLDHPFIKFCLYYQHDKFDHCIDIVNNLFDPNLHHIFAAMFLYKNAIQFAQQIKGLCMLDQLIIDLEYSEKFQTKITPEYLNTLLEDKNYSLEQQNAILNYIAVNLHQHKKFQDVNIIVQYALASNKMERSSLLPLLSKDINLIQYHAVKSCGICIAPYLLMQQGEIKEKDSLIKLWISQLETTLNACIKI